MMIQNAQRTALVTGASSGIGRELAKLLARDGYNLVLVARNKEALNRLAVEIKTQNNLTITIIPMDLSDSRAPREVYDGTIRARIAIDILVNDAGFGSFGFFADTSLETEMRLIEVNIAALTALTKLFVGDMKARKLGRIMNVASTAAFWPGPLMAVYYASKAYVLSFSEALANELQGTGITVTALCPGPTRTEFQRRAGMEKSGLMQRIGTMDAETVARAGYRGLMRGKIVVVPGFINKITAWLPSLVPRGIATAIIRRMQNERL